ncbi:unnamed protein product [Mycena citricolor]|uniref:CCHC-type domain-containing protein n=1 Tax=Mycena citricolor TaxID=2018698 RepID=A0AAD2JYW8_9AGAR|nr:unnamed protein product [Mycena citricolor]
MHHPPTNPTPNNLADLPTPAQKTTRTAEGGFQRARDRREEENFSPKRKEATHHAQTVASTLPPPTGNGSKTPYNPPTRTLTPTPSETESEMRMMTDETPPPCRDKNPHLKLIAERPAPRPNTNGENPFQRIQGGTFLEHHISLERLLRGVSQEQRETIEKWGAGKTIALLFTIGGQHLFDTLKDEIEKTVKLSLSGITKNVPIYYYTPILDSDPMVAFLRCDDPAMHTAILAEPFIAVNTEIAYWPSSMAERRSWMVMYMELSATKNKEEMKGQILGTVREVMHTNEEIAQVIDQITQMEPGTRDERIDSLALSVDAQCLDHESKSVIVIYMDRRKGSKPEQETLGELLRKKVYVTNAIQYKPIVDKFTGKIRECVICKLDNHPSYLCLFTRAKWWGPPDQISALVIIRPLFILSSTISSYLGTTYLITDHGIRRSGLGVPGDYPYRFKAARHMLQKVLLQPMTSAPCAHESTISYRFPSSSGSPSPPPIIPSSPDLAHQNQPGPSNPYLALPPPEDEIPDLGELPSEQPPSPPPTAPAPTMSGHHRITLAANPPYFDGDKSRYMGFVDSCTTYIGAYRSEFSQDKTKILFILSLNGLKAGVTSATFLEELQRAFGDSNAEQVAAARLMALRQNRRSFADYISDFEMLAADAGYNVVTSTDDKGEYKKGDQDNILIEFLERGLSSEIASRLYNTGVPLPKAYGAFKNWCVNIEANALRDQLRKASHAQSAPRPPPQFRPQAAPTTPAPAPARPTANELVPMEIDRTHARGRNIICYNCQQPGHIARNCPEPRKKRTFFNRATMLEEIENGDKDNEFLKEIAEKLREKGF